MNSSRDIDLTPLVIEVLNSLSRYNTKIEPIEKPSGERIGGFIAPSRLSVNDTYKCALNMFPEEHLKQIGLKHIKRASSRTYTDHDKAAFSINSTLGNMLHDLILPRLSGLLRLKGYTVEIEKKVWSHDTCVCGKVDLVIFDEDGGMRIFDLKTSNSEASDKIAPMYQKQLYAYAATLECMYPDKFIKQISIIEVFKFIGKQFKNEDGETIKPVVAVQLKLDYDRLHMLYEETLLELIKHVRDIARKLSPILNKKYWILDRSKSPFQRDSLIDKFNSNNRLA